MHTSVVGAASLGWTIGRLLPVLATLDPHLLSLPLQQPTAAAHTLSWPSLRCSVAGQPAFFLHHHAADNRQAHSAVRAAAATATPRRAQRGHCLWYVATLVETRAGFATIAAAVSARDTRDCFPSLITLVAVLLLPLHCAAHDFCLTVDTLAGCVLLPLAPVPHGIAYPSWTPLLGMLPLLFAQCHMGLLSLCKKRCGLLLLRSSCHVYLLPLYGFPLVGWTLLFRATCHTG